MLRLLSVVLKNRFSCFNGNGYLLRVTILRTKKLTLTYLSKTKTTFQVSVGLVFKASEHLKVKQLAVNKQEVLTFFKISRCFVLKRERNLYLQVLRACRHCYILKVCWYKVS